MTHPNGDIYQGDWINGKAHGSGCFAQVHAGSIYDGDWNMDVMDGKGKLIWDFGACNYEGDFLNGQRTGYGIFNKGGVERYEG